MARAIKKNEHVRYRDWKGRIRKFNPRLKLFAEVWSKTSNKKLRTINKTSRRFTSKQRSLFHTSRERPLRIIKRGTSDWVRIYMGKEVIHQIPDWFVRPINKMIDEYGQIAWGLNMRTKDGGTPRNVYPENFDKKQRPSYWKEDMRTKMIAILRQDKIRTSPKAISKKHGNTYWKSGNFRYFKWVEIQLELVSAKRDIY